MLGNDALHSEDMMREMWGDSMKAMNCSQARITYEDFLLLMKGQTRETTDVDALEMVAKHRNALEMSVSQLGVVMEERAEDMPATPPTIHPNTSPDKLASKSPLIPTLMAHGDSEDTPLSMDDDDDIVPLKMGPSTHATPPTTPLRISLGSSPLHSRLESPGPMVKTNSNPDFSVSAITESPPTIPKPRPYIRSKSRSYDGTNTSSESSPEDGAAQVFATDSRRALRLPELNKELRGDLVDDSKTALQHNRQLYRAHRQMRLSVMEASKRFEEQQVRHARDVLLAQQKENDMKKGQAGLVMRRVENKTVSTEAVKKLLEQNHKDRLSLMEAANRRSGRGRRNRKKTISDIGGMLGSLSQDDMAKINEAASNSTKDFQPSVPEIIETCPAEVLETNPRGATVPGEFHNVNDPFGAHGRYGHFS